MKESLRIVFLGTPEFAVASLKVLVSAKCNLVAVITAPDKPQGRGKQLGMSPVKEFAMSAGLPVLQPTNLKSPEFLEELRAYKSDLQIVVAFRMLPELVWNMPVLGTFNLHGSLLPQYRGAAPINWAIINGEKETGVTTFFLKHQIDTGKIIFQEKETIRDDDNVGSLYERLMYKGAELVLRTVRAIESDDYPQIEQNELGELKHAPKLFRDNCEIDWNKPANEIRDFVRGLSPYPAAWTMLNELSLKIFRVEFSNEKSSKPLGLFDSDGKNYIRVNTGNGVLEIMELQLQGKKRMKVDEFLRGYQL
jgi:methionyl-tRNA formyltransferase